MPEKQTNELSELKQSLAQVQSQLSQLLEKNTELEADNRNLRDEIDREKRGKPPETEAVEQVKARYLEPRAEKIGHVYEARLVFPNVKGWKNPETRKTDPLQIRPFRVVLAYDAGVEVGAEVPESVMVDLVHEYNKRHNTEVKHQEMRATYLGPVGKAQVLVA